MYSPAATEGIGLLSIAKATITASRGVRGSARPSCGASWPISIPPPFHPWSRPRRCSASGTSTPITGIAMPPTPIDDFVVCFQYRDDALRFRDALGKRLGKFGLTLDAAFWILLSHAIQHGKIEAGQHVSDPSSTAGLGLSFKPVDQVDDGVEPTTGASADAVAGDSNGEMTFACTGAADQNGVALLREERAAGEFAHQTFVDRAAGEFEVSQLLGQWQLGGGHLVADRAGLLLGDLGCEQIAHDLLYGMLTFNPVGQHLIERGTHARELQIAHHLQDLMTFHGATSVGCRSARSPLPARGAGPRLEGRRLRAAVRVGAAATGH